VIERQSRCDRGQRTPAPYNLSPPSWFEVLNTLRCIRRQPDTMPHYTVLDGERACRGGDDLAPDAVPSQSEDGSVCREAPTTIIASRKARAATDACEETNPSNAPNNPNAARVIGMRYRGKGRSTTVVATGFQRIPMSCLTPDRLARTSPQPLQQGTASDSAHAPVEGCRRSCRLAEERPAEVVVARHRARRTEGAEVPRR